MRLLTVVGALLSLGSLVATAPAGISLDVRNDAKVDCGTTTIYVTAPKSSGGSYSMTSTRTSFETAFVTTTVGKSTATTVIQVKVPSSDVSSPASASAISAIIDDSAFIPISSEIQSSVDEITTLRTTQTRTRTLTIYETTTDINGDVEVNPVTVVEEPLTEITAAPQVITLLSTWTRWFTATSLTTTTLPDGNVVVTSYTTTNDALATVSNGKQVYDGPATTSSATALSEAQENTFGPDDDFVVVSVTNVVVPLITMPPPVETTSTESTSTKTTVSNGQPVGTPHAPFPIFTVDPVSTSIAALVDHLDEDEKTTTLYSSISVTISVTTSSLNTADALETLVTSAAAAATGSSSYSVVSGGNSSAPAQTYSGAPLGWNNTYASATKVYAAAPMYGYDHLSHDYSATSAGFTAPVLSIYVSTQTAASLAAPFLGVPSASYAPVISRIASADPVFSSSLPVESSVVSGSSATASLSTLVAHYGNPNPYMPAFDSAVYATLTFATEIGSLSSTDAVLTSSTAYTDATSVASLFSHVVTDLPYAAPSHGASYSSLSDSSSEASNATMTTALGDGVSSTTQVTSVVPTSIEAPSFLVPTSTSFDLPSVQSSATVSTSELPASILSFLSSVANDATASHSVNTVPPAGFSSFTAFSAPPVPTSLLTSTPTEDSASIVSTSELPASILSFLSSVANDATASHLVNTVPPAGFSSFTAFSAPPVPSSLLTSTPTEVSASIVSSSISSTSAASTSCGEQSAVSLNFDDIPPLVGNVDQPLPISSPYKHFFFSEGFAVGPPPRIPFTPETAPLVLQFQTQTNVNVTRNHNDPAPGEYGATGEIGNGPNLRYGCYSFDAVAAYVGCDSLGPDCEWQFTGVIYNNMTGQYDETSTQFARTPGCPAGEGCPLTDVVLLDKFENIQSLRINATVEGVPKIWWMDNLQLRWADDSCDAGICRASHR